MQLDRGMAQPDCSPAAERNKQPIADLLRQVLPAQGTALEIASGTGQHVVWFAQQLPGWTWQPTEVHRGALYNIEVRVAQAYLANVLDPVQLDVLVQPWLPAEQVPTSFDLIFCANMLHIAPWQACAALMLGSARHLAPGGVLITYGPYFEHGVTPAPSNVEFDKSMRAHDTSWGIRQLEDLKQEGQRAGLRLCARHAMLANNFLLVWGRS
jgi:SAM-dependent methyltransferase